MEPIKPATQRVISALATHGLIVEIRTFFQGTRTAVQAADAIGTNVAQIVKSLIFLADEETILVLVSGENRVDTNHLANLIGKSISQAPADIVRTVTGYSIGGVPPLAHATSLPVYMDESLLRFEEIWAAAGTPHTVFPIAPTKLQQITQAQVITVHPS
jgi:Cys-tRNA(Pro) deacylase